MAPTCSSSGWSIPGRCRSASVWWPYSGGASGEGLSKVSRVLIILLLQDDELVLGARTTRIFLF